MKNLNFVFWGTPEVASKTLEILKDSGYLPSLIITSPDKPQGRKMIITPPAVKTWAQQNDIPYLQPEKITPELFSTFNFQLFVVVAYGKILPEEVINLPELGTINIHYSLLPKYRGASPVESALLNGDRETGVCLQKMVYKLDSGPIICQKEIPIEIDETKNKLREKLIKEGAHLLVEYLPQIIEGDLKLKDQDKNKATFCKKMQKEDGLIDLSDKPKKLYNKYRAYEGWPGIYFFFNGKRIKITKAKYKNETFVIQRVIPEGKKEIDYNSFINTLK